MSAPGLTPANESPACQREPHHLYSRRYDGPGASEEVRGGPYSAPQRYHETRVERRREPSKAKEARA